MNHAEKQGFQAERVGEFAPPAVPAEPAPAIPDHQLLAAIAAGSYGEVWLARNAVGTLRAVKIVRRDHHASAESFDREFKGLQKFEPVSRAHEGLVDILTLGLLPDGVGFYYVMELADDAKREPGDGVMESRNDAKKSSVHHSTNPPLQSPNSYEARTLRHDLKQHGYLPVDVCVQLGLKLTAALTHLHAQGLVHRDVKPSNILFIRGEPKLADAGLVAAMDDARSLVGTTGYIAPEGPGTPQADLYALGKVLYEAALGKDRQDFPQLPSDLRSRPDHAGLLEFNAILLKACAINPRERYQSAEAMRAEIESLSRGESVRRSRRLKQGYRILKKICLAAVSYALMVAAMSAFLGRKPSGEQHSAVPGVDALVARGVQCGTSQTPERLEQARQFFAQAAQLDPKFAPAFIGLFRTLMLMHSASPCVLEDNAANVRAAATRLAAIAPDLAEGRLASSWLQYMDGNWPKAAAQGRMATRMPTGSGRDGVCMVHGVYGWYLLNVGEPEAALHEFLFAEQASPADITIQMHLGQPFRVWRKFDQALAYYQKSALIEPRQYWAHYCIGHVYEEMEDFEKAIQAFQRADLECGRDEGRTKLLYEGLLTAFRQDGKRGYWNRQLEIASNQAPQSLHDMAVACAKLDQTNQAYEHLQKACDEGQLGGLWFDLCWDHTDPRFKSIARKVMLKP